MASLREEISDIKITLSQIEEKCKNLLKHLQIQEENYSVTLKNYENKLDQLLKQKNEEIDKLLREKCRLEATTLGEEDPVLQYKF